MGATVIDMGARQREAAIAIRWPDGRVNRAGSSAALLRQIKDAQWEPMNRRRFRRLMAHRAKVWSGTQIHPWLSARRFVQALAEAGMFTILEDS